MTASTPVRGLPYPEPNDPINAYPTVAQQMAGQLDTHSHDRGTVSSAQYADQAGNADTLDGQHGSAFAQASHGTHVASGGRNTYTTDSDGRFIPGGQYPVCMNGDWFLNGTLMIFQGSTGWVRAMLLWGNADGGLVVISGGVVAANTTVTVNNVSV